MADHFVYGKTPDGRCASWPRAAHEGKMMQVRGHTGSGKSLLLTNLVTQFVKPYRQLGSDAIDPVVIIDPGGDLFFFNQLKEKCERIGRTFRWLSLDPLDGGFYFDPLQSCKALHGSAARKANFVAAGLNLVYAEGFGRGYFARLNLTTIRTAFKQLEFKGLSSPTLIELAEELAEMAKRHRGSDAAEALFALDQLLDYPQLSPVGDATRRIDISLALEECHVLYFFLPTLLDQLAARAVATLASYSIVIEATYRKKLGRSKRTTHLVLEEAAQIAHGQSFADTLTLARKAGVRILLSHQSTAQLRGGAGDFDMSQIVRDNCQIRVCFTTAADGDDVNDLLSYSKDDKSAKRKGTSTHMFSTTLSEQEVDEPLIKRDEVLDVNATFGHAYVIFHDGSGHNEPVHIAADFPTSQTVYDELSNRPLPKRPEPATEGPGDAANADTTDATQDAAHAERVAKLAALLVDRQRDERWELRG